MDDGLTGLRATASIALVNKILRVQKCTNPLRQKGRVRLRLVARLLGPVKPDLGGPHGKAPHIIEKII